MSRKLVFRAVALGCLILALVSFLPQQDRDNGKLGDAPGSQPVQQDVAKQATRGRRIPASPHQDEIVRATNHFRSL